jgi:predicted phosphodiesterase
MLGLLSDAHGNLAAFDRGLALLRREGAETIHFLGDAIGYIPNIAVLERLRAEEIPCIMGNHEAMMLSGDFPPEREAAYRLGEIKAMLSPDWLAWIASWPRQREIGAGDWRLLLLHGSPLDPTFAYVYPDTDLAPFADTPADAVFMGNTHRPFIRKAGNTQFVNIGSAGLPRDHAAWGSVCLYDPDTHRARILRYPIEDTIPPLLAAYPDLHQAVLTTFDRRPDGEIYGDLCR